MPGYFVAWRSRRFASANLRILTKRVTLATDLVCDEMSIQLEGQYFLNNIIERQFRNSKPVFQSDLGKTVTSASPRRKSDKGKFDSYKTTEYTAEFRNAYRVYKLFFSS